MTWQLGNGLYQSEAETAPTQNWKADFQTREREPPDRWDMEFLDGPGSLQAAGPKPWKGAATFIPKVPVATKKQHIDDNKVRLSLFFFLNY